MPELSHGSPMDPKGLHECPLCTSSDIEILDETNLVIYLHCNNCDHNWEEYK